MQELKAKAHCCEEASTLSHNFYIPCNRPAFSVVGWKGRSETPIRMCQMCEDHNMRNRGGYRVSFYEGPAREDRKHLPDGMVLRRRRP